jgi:flagellar protein FliJ
MKRFKFRLERVLDYKEVEKDERSRELAVRNRELREREERLDEIVDAHEKVVCPTNEVITMAELNLMGQYQEALRQALIQQRLLILEAADAVEAARDAYIEKSIEVETYETLKAKKREVFKDELKRKERKDLDEITVQRHRFRKGGKDDGGKDGE